MIAHVRWLYCERDATPRPPSVPAPTLTVETSAGRYQDWWELDRPVDATTAASYLRRIAAAYGIGNEAVDAARILRLPGTLNLKPERGRFVVALVHDRGAVYAGADFDHLPAPAARTSPPTADTTATPITKNRNVYLTRRGGQLRRLGFDEAVILATLLAENAERCQPPLDDDEVATIAHSVARYAPAAPAADDHEAFQDAAPDDDVALAPVTRFPTAARGDAPATVRFHNTELGNAERLVAYHGQHIRYCHPMARWFLWDGRRWKRDEDRAIERRMKAVVRDLFVAALDESLPKDERVALIKWAFKSEARSVLRNSVDLAIADPEIAITLTDLDRDAHLLTVRNGTINLKTGALRPHDPADFITHLVDASYDPAAPCPHWLAFLERVLPDPAVRAFVQRAVGYSLTGETSERALLIPWGDGRNGKTTLLETVQSVLGDYAVRTDTKTFMVQRHHDNREYATAELLGARMVYSVEGEEDARFAEAFVKEVTGGDRLSGRHPYGRPFHFAPTHTLWLATNHRPEIRGVDNAIWDRMRLIPFTVVIPEAERKPKHEVQAMFAAELPGILAWAVQGAVAWYRQGLGTAAAITDANAAYRTDMDILAPWIADCCVEGPHCTAAAKALRESYEAWCAANGTTPVNGQTFGRRLTGRKYTQGRTNTARSWTGIGLKSDDPPPVQPPFPPPEDDTTKNGPSDVVTDSDGLSGTSLMRNEDLEKFRQNRHYPSLSVTDNVNESDESLRGKEKPSVTDSPLASPPSAPPADMSPPVPAASPADISTAQSPAASVADRQHTAVASWAPSAVAGNEAGRTAPRPVIHFCRTHGITITDDRRATGRAVLNELARLAATAGVQRE
jgi:P4 family phage/plasmid primase-like protien